MRTYQAQESAVIRASAAHVYSILSDYHEKHRAILPTRYFKNLQVVKGGQGAGTVIDVAMDVYGQQFNYHMTVSEPEPGRILKEEDPQVGLATTFTVDPLNDRESKITIQSVAKASPGFKGWVEKLMTPSIMRRIYREQLAQLALLAEK
ncbi:MAG: SRPBCC family protein [Anaerolineales bacterium]|nr:SRPBCC family protein [Anaerolineales bacterium]